MCRKVTPCAYNFALFRSCILLCLHDADNPPISCLYNVDSLPALSNLTKELASMTSDIWEERPHNVPRHPLSDITNADQPSSMDLHEKRELMKARRRAAYRKKKEKATVKQQDEKLSALTISGKNASWEGTAMILYILPPFHNIMLTSNHMQICKMFPCYLSVISLRCVNQPRWTLTRKKS